MKNAFASRNIKPDLDCVSGASAWECMSMIKNRLADLITLDPADAYRANRYFGLEPLAAEDYGTMTDSPIYYAVAVVKRTDLSTNLWNLRNKRACGTGFGDMAGWHVPVSYLIGNNYSRQRPNLSFPTFHINMLYILGISISFLNFSFIFYQFLKQQI